MADEAVITGFLASVAKAWGGAPEVGEACELARGACRYVSYEVLRSAYTSLRELVRPTGTPGAMASVICNAVEAAQDALPERVKPITHPNPEAREQADKIAGLLNWRQTEGLGDPAGAFPCLCGWRGKTLMEARIHHTHLMPERVREKYRAIYAQEQRERGEG